MKQRYYDLQKLLETKAPYLILFGMRSNGKSYAVKKHIIEEALKGNRFVYLRRWKEDLKLAAVSTYFDDMPVREMTHNQYVGIMPYQGYFYFYDIGEDDKPKRAREPIGRYCALNEWERYKSNVFKNYTSIVFEEFITTGLYLGNSEVSEDQLLMQFVSTVSRLEDIRVFLIGNTISRLSPYFKNWSLHNVMKMKPGSIDIYHLKGENGVVDVAVEYCEAVATKSKMFFGNTSKQIINGEWEVNEYPRLLKPYKYHDMLYELGVEYGDFSYAMQLMQDPDTEGLFIYIYPNTKKRKFDRMITDKFTTNPMFNNGFRRRSKVESKMAECFREKKVCFSDNLTGTDFNQILSIYDFRIAV